MTVLQQASLSVNVASGDPLDVREFVIHERISSLFSVALTAVTENPDIDFEAIIGKPARFEMQRSLQGTTQTRVWTGICKEVQEIAVEEAGLSTYAIEIVPSLFLATERRNHRMFQRMSDLDIVLKLLAEWGTNPVQKLSGIYKKREYRVQYGESDYTFLCRLLEDAGISFYFDDREGASKLVLSDTPHTLVVREPRIRFWDSPGDGDWEYVTALRVGRRVRSGRYTMRDHDYRRPPSYKLFATAAATGFEERLERFHYTPGAFLFESDKGDFTPSADDKGRYRSDEAEASAMAQRRLEGKRSEVFSCTFKSNVIDLAPGVVISVLHHPQRELGEDRRLLLVATTIHGAATGKEWVVDGEARSADMPYRPALSTPRPKVNGVESATVVGPAGEEIHTDEFGRVRVHFHWDRESQMDDNSSCWIHVSQPWSGTGYGMINLPRIGQEVLVDFLGGDPDRPVIVGRVYTNLQKVPYTLPSHKTQSGWKSNSTTGTGGFNEIMFEDGAGQELFRMQAEKDMHKLVKHDEQSVVGRDRTRNVKRNESVTIGKNRTKQVVQTERVTIGHNQSITVGVNRSAQIGATDSTTVGHTHLVMISPPEEEDGPATSSSSTMTDKKIVLCTGAGATITMERDKITLEAENIQIIARDKIDLVGKTRGIGLAAPQGSANLSSKDAFEVSTQTISLTGTDVKITGTTLALGGTSSAELTSSGATTVSGTPVQLNGPGLFAGRVTELAPAAITTGAALVLVGGASFPLPVVRQADGSLQIGDHLIIRPGTGRYPDFQNRVLRDLGIMSSTPSGLQRLNNIQNNPGGHNVTIREYSAAEATQWGTNNSLAYPGSGDRALGYDSNGNPVPGSGTDTEIAYNPDIQLGPSGNPEPSDATLFHEMGHAEHNAYGTNRSGESMGGGWDNREEWQNIDGGVNQPGGSSIPGVPQSPSENDYLGDRNYPYRRTDHGSGYSNPDGTPITP